MLDCCLGWMADGEPSMIMAVQRPRGPMGWDPEYAHLGWPSDTTVVQRKRWREQYDAGQREAGCDWVQPPRSQSGRSDAGQVPPMRNPTRPPLTDEDRINGRPGLTGRTRYRLGWRGRLILQVEHATHHRQSSGWVVYPPYMISEWRDATVADLTTVSSGRASGMLPDPASHSSRGRSICGWW